jgi:hypothetical protein
VTGRLGRFALGMMKKKAQSLGDEFALNLQRKLEAIGVAAAAATPAEPPARVDPAAPVPTPASEVSPANIEAGISAAPKRNSWQALLAWFRGADAARPADTPKAGD